MCNWGNEYIEKNNIVIKVPERGIINLKKKNTILKRNKQKLLVYIV